MKIATNIIITLFFIIYPNIIYAQTATNEGESVLQKVKEKVEAIRKNPKAFVGTVTDKTQDTVQIKNLSGKIQQIAIKENVSFVKIGKTSTNIKFADIALGDFIIAMGYTEINNILDAKRVLLVSPITDSTRKIIFGNITSIIKKEAVITNNNGEKIIDISFPKNWRGPEIKDLTDGARVLVIVENQNEKQIVRTIQIISKESESLKTATPQLTPKNSPTPTR